MSDESKTQLLLFNMGKDPSHIWIAISSESKHLSNWGIGILRGGLDPYVKTIVLEKNYTCKDHKNLFSHYYSKKFKTTSAFCDRLHFFNRHFDDLSAIVFESDVYQDSYIGFTIIRPVTQRCLGRTVIDPEKVGKEFAEGHFALRTTFDVSFLGAKYSIKGYPYTSQDTDATVCAHSALWGVCRYLSERYQRYREVYPFDLIRMTGIVEGRTFPYRGMTYQDYSTILTEFGCFPVIMRLSDRAGKRSESDFLDLCAYVESGFPVLASLSGHVIALCGHTLDYDIELEKYDKNSFIPSSLFLKQFILLFAPYQKKHSCQRIRLVTKL